MASSITKPSIIIVPGSFSPSTYHTTIVDQLKSHSYEAVALDYPSIGHRDPRPAATIEEDAAYIRNVTSKLADGGKDVILVSHSYGGIPATESTKGLSKEERKAAGKQGGVRNLVSCRAWFRRWGVV